MTGLGLMDDQKGTVPGTEVNNSVNFVDLNQTGANLVDAAKHNLIDAINEDSSKLSESSKKINPKKASEEVCRICLGTEDEGTPGEDGEPDRLICPCKCAGSMGLIHISCLKEWVNSKRLVYKGKKV